MQSMTLKELKGKYARLREEINSFGDAGHPNHAKLARLTFELDRVEEEFATYRRRADAAPTLSEIIPLDSLPQYLDQKYRQQPQRTPAHA
jgi:hypothetical protein